MVTGLLETANICKFKNRKQSKEFLGILKGSHYYIASHNK